MSLKFLIAFSMIVFMIGSFGATPVASTTTTQPTNFVMNSDSFTWVNLTNDAYPNAFSYSYNISSTNSENLTLRIELYNNNTQVTYLYDVINNTVPVANNTVVNTVNYNFTQSGLFSAKIYWFSQSNQILYYKEISSSEIVGLNGSVYNLGYKMLYGWQLVNDQSGNPALNFTVNFYFTGTYNVTFNYALKFQNSNNAKYDQLFTGSKQMTGTNDTFQNLNWVVSLYPGIYNVSLTYRNFLIYPLTSVNKTVSFTVNVPNGNYPQNYNNGYYGHPGRYYNQDVGVLPGILSFFFTMGIFAVIGIIVYRSTRKPTRHNTSNGRYQSSFEQRRASSKPLVPTFCSNCGAKVVGTQHYCPDCGTELDWD